MKNKSLTQEKQNKIDKRITELITEEKIWAVYTFNSRIP